MRISTVIMKRQNFESDYEVEEEGEWLFDSTRDPVEQAEILREYKP